jgi:hypothetical protein
MSAQLRIISLPVYVNPDAPNTCNEECPLFGDDDPAWCMAYDRVLQPAQDPALADEWWYERDVRCKGAEAS